MSQSIIWLIGDVSRRQGFHSPPRLPLLKVTNEDEASTASMKYIPCPLKLGIRESGFDVCTYIQDIHLEHLKLFNLHVHHELGKDYHNKVIKGIFFYFQEGLIIPFVLKSNLFLCI